MYVYYNLEYMTTCTCTYTCTCICSKYSKYTCSQYIGHVHVYIQSYSIIIIQQCTMSIFHINLTSCYNVVEKP